MVQGHGGVLFVDKPHGMTSHDVVARVRKLVGTRKVGHAGTLDPAATGLLILGLDSATRLLTYLVGLDKEYLATIRLGESTTTDDAEGEVVERASAPDLAAVTEPRLGDAIANLTGDILQVPSTVSAIKVAGKRAYARARAGESIELEARPVTVSRFELLGSRRDNEFELDVRVECSSGTYVRALARDLGAALGVGGHLTALRRTRVGPFRVEDATSLDEASRDLAIEPLAVAEALFPSLRLTQQQSRDLAHGKRIRVDEPFEQGGAVAAVTPDGRLAGLIRFDGQEGRSLVNFPTPEVLG